MNPLAPRRRPRPAPFHALLLASLLAWPLLTGCEPRDRVINVEKDNAEMNAAIAAARASLPTFWKTFENPAPGDSDFALKVRITDPAGSEHFWATDLTRTNGSIHGVINNDPNTVTSVKFGQRIAIPEADISDWLYLNRDGKMVGNHTLRALFKHMPKEKADALRQRMAAP